MPITKDDVAFWESQCLPSFSSLLTSSGSYTPEQAASHVQFFKDHVIPHIGPKPKSGGAYLLAHTGSVIENSINFSDKLKTPLIRFIFQPMGIEGIPEATNADMGWFHQTARTFCLSDAEKATLKEKVPELSAIPQYLVGFDLEPDERRTFKAYFAPMYKHILHQADTDQLIYDLVRSLHKGETLIPALEKIEAFRKEEPQRPVDCIGIDCIKPEEGARFKLYTRLPKDTNNWSFMKHQMTLNGRLTDETVLEGLEILKAIWHLLFDEPEGLAEEDRSKVEMHTDGPHFGLLLSWELQPGKADPIPKLYVPLWKFAKSNKAIGENWTKVFQKWNWSWGNDGKYMQDIEKA